MARIIAAPPAAWWVW